MVVLFSEVANGEVVLFSEVANGEVVLFSEVANGEVVLFSEVANGEVVLFSEVAKGIVRDCPLLRGCKCIHWSFVHLYRRSITYLCPLQMVFECVTNSAFKKILAKNYIHQYSVR